MKKIRVLPDSVAQQIAAGEVVERPASVVKELIENALDAGATRVQVRVEKAGVKSIEVEDDGTGIGKDELTLAVTSFATSKITSAEDLLEVQSFGFRGEALAAIAAVSKCTLTSSTSKSGEGWQLRVSGGKAGKIKPAARERGTTVRVEDLFYNTPARRKFLKAETTERRRLLETVLAFALAEPKLEIHLSDDGRSVLDLVATESWRQRVEAVLGATTAKHLVSIEGTGRTTRIHGFTTLPTHTRSNRNHQFLYINRRLVRERSMQQALQQAYRTIIPPRRFPVTVLSLEMPAHLVDVNVHPNKVEVRLRNEREVYDVVHRAVKAALSPAMESNLSVHYPVGDRLGDETATMAGADEAKPELKLVDLPSKSGDPYVSRVENAYESFMEKSSTVKEFNPQLSLRSTPVKDSADVEEVARQVRRDEALFWQFNNAFIFIQVKGGLVVIDQHAAHERIIFDTALKQLKNEVTITQQILFPIHLELSLAEFELFRSSKDVFKQLGFHLEPFGGKSILVRGYPQGLKNWAEGRLLLQVFDDIINERVPGASHLDRVVASFACRSAVKAGQRLSNEEMKMLADQLFAIPNPYSCPHGRPTLQRISIEEVEGWFLRR